MLHARECNDINNLATTWLSLTQHKAIKIEWEMYINAV